MKMTGLAKNIATIFHLGCFPIASGSWASALGIAFIWALRSLVWWQYLLLTALLFFLGLWASAVTEKTLQKKDPSCVVIDEWVGVMVSFFLIPLSWPIVIMGFFLFRAFDMFKIPPADYFESQGGGRGIMLDDLVAGVYTNIILHLSIFLIKYFHITIESNIFI